MGTKKLSWLCIALVISRSLVQFPAGALWSVLGQDSLFHIASVYQAAKWINEAVLRACALYAASCSGISPRGIEMVSVCTGLLGGEGRVSASWIQDYKPNTCTFPITLVHHQSFWTKKILNVPPRRRFRSWVVQRYEHVLEVHRGLQGTF